MPARNSGPAPTDAAISVTGLSKRYGRTVALDDVALTVPRNAVFALLGPNGAGKTTAMKILLGLAHPSAGRGTILGARIGDVEIRGRVGYLPELFRFPAWMTVRRALAFHCALARVPRDKWTERTRAALEGVRLASRIDDRVGTLSKGLQQRLGLAIALVAEPELVMLDEPTTGLDPAERHQFRELVTGLKVRGATVVLNTHLLSEVEQICDHLAVLSNGRIVAAGTLAEFMRPDATGRGSLEARYLRLVADA